MRSARIVAAICLAGMTASCATTRNEPDELCDELAAFANAAASDGNHTVRLTTDWGGVFTKSNGANEELMYSKSCEHNSYAPSRTLCAYLLENTSTEFAGINVRRALRCIGVRVSGISPTNDDRLPPSARSHAVLGEPVRSEILVEFAPATDSSPPTLSITAMGQPSS
jgi:hypothetical protein